MAQLATQILSDDEEFQRRLGRLLRTGPVPVSVLEGRSSVGSADVLIVDVRGDTSGGMAIIERVRAGVPNAAIFAVASSGEPDLILQSMRAGANEFLIWPPAEETFFGALRRTAARREATQGTRSAATSLVFFGAKGGAGTTTMAVNCGVEIARLTRKSTVIVDLKPGLGEVSLFLGVKPRYSILDALDNLHRLDREFLRELTVKHKSGIEILAGSEHFDRPGVGDVSGIEELFRLLAREYEYVVIDAGSQINSCTSAALYAADQLFLVANPDVPSLRNAQRILERVRELGALGERVRLLLNRAAEPLPIPQKQMEAALGHPIHHMFPSDYKTVSTALNAGVPIAMAGGSDIATQFDQFTRRVLDPGAEFGTPGSKRSMLGLEKIASLW